MVALHGDIQRAFEEDIPFESFQRNYRWGLYKWFAGKTFLFHLWDYSVQASEELFKTKTNLFMRCNLSVYVMTHNISSHLITSHQFSLISSHFSFHFWTHHISSQLILSYLIPSHFISLVLSQSLYYLHYLYFFFYLSSRLFDFLSCFLFKSYPLSSLVLFWTIFSSFSLLLYFLVNPMFCNFAALEATRRRIDEDEVAGSMLSGTGQSNILFHSLVFN